MNSANTVWLSLIPFAFFFLWLFFFARGRGEICPDCGKPLPFIQSPFTKTLRQWVEGGDVCQNCGCETDMAGNKVTAGTPPKPRSILVGFGLIMLGALPGIVLLTLILRR